MQGTDAFMVEARGTAPRSSLQLIGFNVTILFKHLYTKMSSSFLTFIAFLGFFIGSSQLSAM